MKEYFKQEAKRHSILVTLANCYKIKGNYLIEDSIYYINLFELSKNLLSFHNTEIQFLNFSIKMLF